MTRPPHIDWERTTAYATDLSGIKAYTYGGVIINQDSLNGANYEETRTAIMELLQSRCVDSDGSSLIDFIARREDLYAGPYLGKFPDILLEFKYGYGVGWATDVPLFTVADSQNLVPGSHRGATGTFLFRGESGSRGSGCGFA